MCDYSLENVLSRPAAVADRLVTTTFPNTITRGFAAVDDVHTAVCLRPGTELAFERPVEYDHPVTHMRAIRAEIRRLGALSGDELYVAAKELQAPYPLVKEVAETGKLPVVLFTAGGIATPADAAMMMQLGAEGVFVGSGIFKSGNPAQRAEAIVRATTFYDDPDVIAKVSRGLGEAMVGINVEEIPQPHRLAERGW